MVFNLKNTEVVQSNVSSDVKQDAETLFEGLGLDVSTAIRMFLIMAIKRNGFPFEVRDTPEIPNEETQKAIMESVSGKNMSQAYDSVDEMVRDLTEELSA
jgi:DNA-damage-inducible protein J